MYQKTRGSGATLNECNFLHSKEKNSEDIKTERPSSFLCQTAEAQGLHSLSALFSAKVHISQKKNQRRPSQDFTSRRTRIKSTTTRSLKLNHEMLGGLSMGNPTGPPIDCTIGKWTLLTRPTAQSPRRTRSKTTCKTKTPIRIIQGKVPEA